MASHHPPNCWSQRPIFQNKKCKCGKMAAVRISESSSNPGRLYFACKDDKCKFFEWWKAPAGKMIFFQNRRCKCGKRAEVGILESSTNPGWLYFSCELEKCKLFEWWKAPIGDAPSSNTNCQTQSYVPITECHGQGSAIAEQRAFYEMAKTMFIGSIFMMCFCLTILVVAVVLK